jgi:hypothetical protein
VVVGDVVKESINALAKVFNPKNFAAGKQLKLAKEKGAATTILLLESDVFYYQCIARDYIQKLENQLIFDIDSIYLVYLQDHPEKPSVIEIYAGRQIV